MRLSLVLLPGLFYLAFATPSFAQPDGNYTLSLTSDVESVEPGEDFDVAVVLDFADGDAIQGYEWGICHDDDVLSLEEDNIVNGAALEDLDFTFFIVTVFDDEDASGWVGGGVFDIFAGEEIGPADSVELFVAAYGTNDDTEAEFTIIEWCETLGDPLVMVNVVVEGQSVTPVLNDLAYGDLGTFFVRGDADADGLVGITDVFAIIEVAFLGQDSVDCLAAADVAGDTAGELGVLDILYVLEYVFLEGPPPEAPFPDCGFSGAGEDCESHAFCE